jgi:hypothetical protein
MRKFKFMSVVFLALAMIALTLPSMVFATAETLIGTRGAAGFPVYGKGQAGNLKTAYGTYAITAAVEDGDIFQLCRVPAGATVIGGRFYAGDIDATTETAALDMDVGWASNGSDAADPDGLLDGGTLTGDAVVGVKPETGTSMPFGGVLITSGKQAFAAETVIQVEVNTAAASFAAGSIGVIVHYSMD